MAHHLHHQKPTEDLRGQMSGLGITRGDRTGTGKDEASFSHAKPSTISNPNVGDGSQGAKHPGGRRLIVGCDGTWVNSDSDPNIPSNVTRLCRALNTNDVKPTSAAPRPQQIIYYHRGIGTGGGLANKIIGGGTGSDLSEHARECYGFLVNNYQPGDEIFLFGFSRGAYTARAVSTLINDVGILTAKGMEHFYEVFDDWKNQNVPMRKEEKERIQAETKQEGVFSGMDKAPRIPDPAYVAELERRGYTRPNIPVKVVGVWDTVGALGIPPILGIDLDDTEDVQYSFVNTKVSQSVEHAIQALALDDHRAAFTPCIWERPDPPNNLKSLSQVWFAGVHCNVGGAGGYQDQGLANITLAWMIRKLQELQSGDGSVGVLDFDESYLMWVFGRNVQHCNAAISGVGGYRGWALGKMEETLTTAYSFVGDLKPLKDTTSLSDFLHPGDLPRTPGRYEEWDATEGQKKKTGQMLHGTNERVHASVRVRVAKGGRGLTDKAGYKPKGLDGWNYEGGSQGDPKDPLSSGWVWRGQDRSGKIMGLPEEPLGGFELKLLDYSVAAMSL